MLQEEHVTKGRKNSQWPQQAHPHARHLPETTAERKVRGLEHPVMCFSREWLLYKRFYWFHPAGEQCGRESWTLWQPDGPVRRTRLTKQAFWGDLSCSSLSRICKCLFPGGLLSTLWAPEACGPFFAQHSDSCSVLAHLVDFSSIPTDLYSYPPPMMHVPPSIKMHQLKSFPTYSLMMSLYSIKPSL